MAVPFASSSVLVDVPGYWVEGAQAAGDRKWWLGPLANVNVFVGPNNKGKSRFLRSLFVRIPDNGCVHSVEAIDAATRSLQRARERLTHFFGAEGVIVRLAAPQPLIDVPLTGAREVLDVAQGRQESIGKLLSGNAAPLPIALQEIVNGLQNLQQGCPNDRPKIVEALRYVERLREEIVETLCTFAPRDGFRRVYVPVLRGLRKPGGKGAGDYFLMRTVEDYFSRPPLQTNHLEKTTNPQYIHTGLGLFDEIKRRRAGLLQERASIRLFEQFLGSRFFGGQSVEVIARDRGEAPDMENYTLYIKIGDELERSVAELGDGVAQLVVLTAPIFFHRDENLLFFIEEPENSLHPGFQRLLLDTILNEPCGAKGSRQVFLTTHSNTFLDMTLSTDEVSVFRVAKNLPEGESIEKVPNFKVDPVSNVRLPLLRELGVSNSMVMLTNCTIWVEGISDRLYFGRYLEVYFKHLRAQPRKEGQPAPTQFQEDLHFSFVEYGGSNVTHWSFLDEEHGIDVDRLCGPLFLIADRDSADASKEKRFKLLHDALGSRFVVLPVREVENLLVPEVIAAVVRAYEEDPEFKLRDYRQEDYVDEPLGRFIDQAVLLPDVPSRRRNAKSPYSDVSGTVRDKLGFAHRALANIDDWTKVSPAAQELTKRLWAFIDEHNGMAPLVE